ncbi:MAG: transcription-repair coupling factor, partial [Burkholderiales bacterium]
MVVTATAADAQRLTREIAFFDPNLRIHLLPDWETLPYDGFSPHHDLVSERLETLYLLSQQAFDVVIAAANTALQRLAPAEYLAARTFFFKRGQKLHLDDLRRQLALAGYSHVMQVVSPGEFCVRGGIIDLFPTGSAVPYRIDLDDETIDAIKSFDADSQRTIYPVPEVRLLPAREFPMDEEGRTRFRQSFRNRFDGDPSRVPLYKDVSNGIAPAGIEYYLPLFHTQTATLADYLPANATVCLHGEIEAAALAFWTDTEARHKMLDGNQRHPVLKPAELFMRADELFGALKAYPRVQIDTAPIEAEPPHPSPLTPHASTAELPMLAVERRAQDPLHHLRDFAAAFPGRLLLLADSAGRRETMLEFLQTNGFKAVNVAGYPEFRTSDAKLALAVGPLTGGFILTHDALALVTENELYSTHARTGAGNRERQAAPKTNDAVLRDHSEIKIGD